MAEFVAWVLVPNQNTFENHTCFGLHNKTTRDFHVSSLDIKTEEIEHKNNTSV